MATDTKTPWDRFSAVIVNPIIDSGKELTALFPDSILFASVLFYIITQNISFGVLSIFSLEMSLLHKLVSFVYTKTIGSTENISTKGLKGDAAFAADMKCRPGYKAARLEYERIFMGDTPPSLAMFFWGGLLAYLGGANYSFTQVLLSMRQEWWTRLIVSTVGLGIITLLFFISRVGCEPFGEMVVAFLVGIAAGIVCYVINLSIFGLEAMNFNGLPLLTNKTKSGSPVYVCAPPQ
jgi:hypothetical protein